MSKLSAGDEKFLEALQRHPHLRERMETLVYIAEDADASGDIEKADEAERQIIEEVRQMGNELLRGWSQTRIQKVATQAAKQERVTRAGQKKFVGTVPMERLK